jgi:hypothetical protein
MRAVRRGGSAHRSCDREARAAKWAMHAGASRLARDPGGRREGGATTDCARPRASHQGLHLPGATMLHANYDPLVGSSSCCGSSSSSTISSFKVVENSTCVYCKIQATKNLQARNSCVPHEHSHKKIRKQLLETNKKTSPTLEGNRKSYAFRPKFRPCA